MKFTSFFTFLMILCLFIAPETVESSRRWRRRHKGKRNNNNKEKDCSQSDDPLCCDSATSCYDLADDLQVEGTQSSFVESTIVLYNSLKEYPNDAQLNALYGKLNLFYLLNWDIANTYIQKSLELDNSINNLNCFLFNGWLHGTMRYRDINIGIEYFETAINLVEDANETSNFWPWFEYATYLNVIVDDYEKSQDYYEISIENGGGNNNPFINFFYGLLLRYNLDSSYIDYGETLITSAISFASFLPDIAATNVAFQSSLFNSKGKIEQAQRCCEFAFAMMPNNGSLVDLLCLNGTTPL